jgi:hypothetical protein
VARRLTSREQSLSTVPNIVVLVLTVLVLVVLVLASACSDPRNPESWLSDEFQASLTGSTAERFVAHVREAVRQEQGDDTWLSDTPDEEILELASLWCEDGGSRQSTVVGDELDRRDLDVSPGRAFLPGVPIDEVVTRVADRHEPPLCEALDSPA